MILDLSHNRVELCLHRSTTFFQISFPLKVERLYLQDRYERRQRLTLQEGGSGSGWTYHVNRPQSVLCGVTRLVAVGRDREQEWESRFLGGILFIRVSHTLMADTHMWIGLWENLEEDPDQLKLRFDPDAPSRFDLIG